MSKKPTRARAGVPVATKKTEQGKMRTHQSASFVVESRKEQVIEMYLRGYSMRQIGMRFGVCEATIYKDICEVRDEWKESRLVNFDALRDEQYHRIKVVMNAAWKDYDLSRRKVTKSKAKVDGKWVDKEVVEERPGNPDYLRIVLDCVKEIARLFDLHQTPDTLVNANIQAVTIDWKQMYARDTGPDPLQAQIDGVKLIAKGEVIDAQ